MNRFSNLLIKSIGALTLTGPNGWVPSETE